MVKPSRVRLSATVAARSAAKWAGVTGTGYALGAGLQQASSTGLLLLPMAGLAIGLVNTTVALFPTAGVIVSSVVLAAVAILETVGPPIASRALRWSGDRLDGSGDARHNATPLYTSEIADWQPPHTPDLQAAQHDAAPPGNADAGGNPGAPPGNRS